MRKVFGLIFILVAAALTLSGAKSLGSSEWQGGAYFAGELIGLFFIPLVLGVIGFKWISQPSEQPAK